MTNSSSGEPSIMLTITALVQTACCFQNIRMRLFKRQKFDCLEYKVILAHPLNELLYHINRRKRVLPSYR